MVRVKPDDIRKKGKVPKNASLFFTIFQTFMSGPDKDGKPSPYFGDYPPDFFDFIVIDECHRGGANDESTWRGILEYFAPAVQLGLTATPKDNIDTYRYFGEPVLIYSLKDGINDGFLTPFRVKQISTTLDEYVYTPDDSLIEGDIEVGKRYVEKDFNKFIEIREREAHRVKVFMDQIQPSDKTVVFCASQAHALAARDLVNQMKTSKDPGYCQRVTANDGELGEENLRAFQDNEKTIPTILTTSQKLSTGVDARNIRNIVLMRPINSMIEFKQIIGRGTRMESREVPFRGAGTWLLRPAHQPVQDHGGDSQRRVRNHLAANPVVEPESQMVSGTYPHLRRPPITEAILDINVAPIVEVEATSEFARRVAATHPHVLPIKTTMVVVSADAEQTPLAHGIAGQICWNDGKTRAVQARINGFTINHVRNYQSWESLRDEAHPLWDEYVSVARPAKVSRLGLRYINRIAVPPSGEFGQYVNTHPQVGPRLEFKRPWSDGTLSVDLAPLALIARLAWISTDRK